MKHHAAATVGRTAYRIGAAPLVLLLTLAAGCGPVEERSTPPSDTGRTVQELDEDNGLTSNGLAFNGLAMNGLAFNGLAMNGLASSSFSSWFQQDPELSKLFMKYLVRCTLPAGQTRTYSDSSGTYTWPGNLGLAPGWAGGSPATVEEQQVITACLGALVNKYGRTVNLSVLGASARGESIPYSPAELAAFPQREGCFFGNLFTNEGLFVGNDQPLLPSSKSSLRACALASTNSSSSACPPFVHIGSCEKVCDLDPTETYYTRCTLDGVTYRPITTRLRTQEFVTCGDGICQPSESCGTGNNCGVDCGSCE